MSCALMVKFPSSASGADTQSPLYTIPLVLETLLDQGKTTNYLGEKDDNIGREISPIFIFFLNKCVLYDNKYEEFRNQ